MKSALFTVGYDPSGADGLVRLLTECAVRILVDVRAVPQSVAHPGFDQDSLRRRLEQAGITYHWAGRHLGGGRAARADSRHWALADAALRGFADYMETEPFRRAAGQLLRVASGGPTVVFCGPRMPESCHRSLIADYLVLQGVSVVHLLGAGERREHQLRAEARRESAELVYDRQAGAARA